MEIGIAASVVLNYFEYYINARTGRIIIFPSSGTFLIVIYLLIAVDRARRTFFRFHFTRLTIGYKRYICTMSNFEDVPDCQNKRNNARDAAKSDLTKYSD